jgi:GNAT superfamily N-acetyltransferase
VFVRRLPVGPGNRLIARTHQGCDGDVEEHPGIRPARADELPLLQDIEDAAGQLFADIGMAAIAEDPAPSIDMLGRYQRAGRAWVWADGNDRPVAYLIAAWVDGALHLEQVSVRPEYAGKRIGRALIEHAATWAKAPLTLTTFADVPWNAPLYERYGFRRLAEDELTDGLRAIRKAESEHGLDRWPRVAMRREVPAVPGELP